MIKVDEKIPARNVLTSRVGPFGPFRLHSYSCSLQRYFVLPIVLFPCGLYLFDFKGIRFCGILYRCKSPFLLYPPILSGVHSVCSSRRVESCVLWSLTVWPARGINNQISNFIKIRPLGAERTDGRTDRHDGGSRISQFCKSAYQHIC
jgi:hypothetical protein